MITIKYLFEESVESKKASEYKGKDLPDTSAFIRSNSTSEITVDDEKIREVISCSDGVFKDITCPLSDIKKVTRTDSFIFVHTGKYIYVIYTISLDRDAEKELLAVLEKGKKTVVKKESAPSKITPINNDYWENVKKQNRKKAKAPFLQRFSLPILFAVAFPAFYLVGVLDPIANMGLGISLSYSTIRGTLVAAVEGFLAGFFYIFFKMWFDQQKNPVKIASIVIFPFTVLVFAIIGLLGTIPYAIYTAIKGNNDYAVAKIVNVAAKIVAVLLIAGVIAAIIFIF